MDEASYRLMTWLSPAYPVGAFSYSHGLEWAVETRDITDRETLVSWITDCLRHGNGRSDAILLAHGWRADTDAGRREVADLATALQSSRERALESEAQGAAFMKVTAAVWPGTGIVDASLPYPVAVGLCARTHGATVLAATQAYLWAFAANLVSAGVRLVPLGQTDGQRAQAALMPVVLTVAAEAIGAELDDIGGCALRADIAAMRHETQHVRLFRT